MFYPRSMYDEISDDLAQDSPLWAGRNRFGSIRFGSGLFEKSPVRFGSVRTNKFFQFDSVRTAFSDGSWLGAVRFGSVSRPVPAGSVRFLIPF